MRHRLAAALTAGLSLLGGCDDNNEPPSNIEPTAAFTAECFPAACVFTNSSTDADGTVEAYAWDFGDGSAGATTWDAAHAYASPGEYAVTLTVTDDQGATGTVTVEVPVEEVTSPVNRPPTAAFTVACTDLTCRFTNRSFDPDAGGRLTGYEWSFGDGSAKTMLVDAIHTYGLAGEYVVSLTVRDDRGATTTITNPAHARLPNVSPTASFIWLCTDLTCEFRDQSEDPDGSVTTYQWFFGDGRNSNERNPTHTFQLGGWYSITLNVTDDRGGTGTLHWALGLPAPQFTVSCESTTCRFTPEGGVSNHLYYYWDFGDGASSTDPTPTHTYDVTEPTTFTVRFVITDEWLASAVNSRDVTVTP